MKIIINLFYILLWAVPIGFFAKDFFSVKDLEIILSPSTIKILGFTLKQSMISTVLSFCIAIPPAYCIAYRKNFLSKLLKGLVFIPFFFPVISVVTVFSIIFTSSYLKDYKLLYSLKAIIIANIFYNSPIFVKYLGEGIMRIPKEIIEAMRIDGAGKRQIFLKGKLPMISSQIFKAFILVFTYTFTSFGIILALGGIKFSTIEVEIASILRGSLNFSKAFSLGILQFLVLILINFSGIFIKEYELQGELKEEKLPVWQKIYSILYAAGYYLIVGISLIFSCYNYFTGKFSLKAFEVLFSSEFNTQYPVIQGILNSLGMSALTALLVVVVAYIILRNYSRVTDIIIFSNLGISGAFLAVSLYYLNVLWDIPFVVLLAAGYLFTALPIGYSFMYQYVKKFPLELIEASKLDCTNIFQRFIYVEFPILKNIFISSFFQIFAVIFGEFTIAYTMQIESNFPLVSLVNYSLLSSKKLLEGSALSSLCLIIIIILFYLGERIKRD